MRSPMYERNAGFTLDLKWLFQHKIEFIMFPRTPRDERLFSAELWIRLCRPAILHNVMRFMEDCRRLRRFVIIVVLVVAGM